MARKHVEEGNSKGNPEQGNGEVMIPSFEKKPVLGVLGGPEALLYKSTAFKLLSSLAIKVDEIIFLKRAQIYLNCLLRNNVVMGN